MPEKLAEPVRDALAAAWIEGERLTLTTQLDRKDYKAVDTVLRNLGGAWNRQVKAHLFDYDPTDAIAQVLADGKAPRAAKNESGFVATPPELAQQVIRNFTDLEDRDQREQAAPSVLEPSAGEGALVEAIQQADPHANVLALEPDTQRSDRIPRRGAEVRTTRLEDYLHSPEARTFDLVIQNPPFTVPERPTIWIAHTWHAWALVTPGGRLVSVAPKGLAFREDRKHREVREWIDRYGGGWIDLDEGAFAASGTQVRAVVFWVDKPHGWQPEDDQPAKRKRTPTEGEKQERRSEDQEMKQAVSEALKDPAYAQTVADRVNATPVDCRLRHYSAMNQALVLTQADEHGVAITGHLNTFRGWCEHGRVPVKGSKALRITAAMGDDEQDQADEHGEQKEPRKRFRMTSRFDFSQTTGADE